MSVAEPQAVYRHGKNRDFTEDEFFAMSDEMLTALEKDDKEAYWRIGSMLPIHPVAAKIFKDVYGKEYLLALGLDLTEANLCYGEDWLDESNGR